MLDREELQRLEGVAPVSPEGSSIRREQDQRLREAIRDLPPHYRIVLVLRDLEGFTDEEVGEITACDRERSVCDCTAPAYLCGAN